jgi:iron(III) transport system substrate-binding protein
MLRLIRRTLVAALAASVALPVVAAFAQQKTQLKVYSTLIPENIAEFKKAFEAEYPDIEIIWLRESTGVVTARILAQGDRQEGDAIWGLAVTTVSGLKKKGMLVPHAPKTLAQIRPLFRDKENPPSWVGMEAWVGALCFNTIEAEKLKLPKPVSWFDLLKPEYKGKLVFSNPASSGTGYFHVSSFLQMFGEEKGWAFMDALHKNVAIYEHGGSKPCSMAAKGEFPIGIAYELIGADLKTKGAPIETLLMKEGAGWDMDTAAILKGTKNLDAARKLMDFAASRKANEIYAKFVSQVAMEGVSQPIANYPAGVAEAMIKNDLDWAADNRDRILVEWTKRYSKPN